MKCTPIEIEREGQKIRAIVCGSARVATRPMRCMHKDCGRPTNKLCDWKVGDGKTCDMHICPEHATQPARGKDLCPAHAAEWAKIQRVRKP